MQNSRDIRSPLPHAMLDARFASTCHIKHCIEVWLTRPWFFFSFDKRMMVKSWHSATVSHTHLAGSVAIYGAWPGIGSSDYRAPDLGHSVAATMCPRFAGALPCQTRPAPVAWAARWARSCARCAAPAACSAPSPPCSPSGSTRRSRATRARAHVPRPARAAAAPARLPFCWCCRSTPRLSGSLCPVPRSSPVEQQKWGRGGEGSIGPDARVYPELYLIIRQCRLTFSTTQILWHIPSNKSTKSKNVSGEYSSSPRGPWTFCAMLVLDRCACAITDASAAVWLSRSRLFQGTWLSASPLSRHFCATHTNASWGHAWYTSTQQLRVISAGNRHSWACSGDTEVVSGVYLRQTTMWRLVLIRRKKRSWAMSWCSVRRAPRWPPGSSWPAIMDNSLAVNSPGHVPVGNRSHVHTWCPRTSAWAPAQNGAVFRLWVPKI